MFLISQFLTFLTIDLNFLKENPHVYCTRKSQQWVPVDEKEMQRLIILNVVM